MTNEEQVLKAAEAVATVRAGCAVTGDENLAPIDWWIAEAVIRVVRPELVKCTMRCSVCEGADHHWLDDVDEESGDPIQACKHCNATRPWQEPA